MRSFFSLSSSHLTGILTAKVECTWWFSLGVDELWSLRRSNGCFGSGVVEFVEEEELQDECSF